MDITNFVNISVIDIQCPYKIDSYSFKINL